MATRRSQRRTFLKTVSLGAAALSIRPALAAGEAAKEARPLPVRSTLDGAQADVLVVGGGPAGIGAALAAARWSCVRSSPSRSAWTCPRKQGHDAGWVLCTLAEC